ncbi:MAG: hypothetical protein WDN45_06040 [Caulobacteraceae bacterium]
MAGNIVDNATLTFNRSDNVTFSGAISATISRGRLGGAGGDGNPDPDRFQQLQRPDGPPGRDAGGEQRRQPRDIGQRHHLQRGALRLLNGFAIGRPVTVQAGGGAIDVAGDFTVEYRGVASGPGGGWPRPASEP